MQCNANQTIILLWCLDLLSSDRLNRNRGKRDVIQSNTRRYDNSRGSVVFIASLAWKDCRHHLDEINKIRKLDGDCSRSSLGMSRTQFVGVAQTLLLYGKTTNDSHSVRREKEIPVAHCRLYGTHTVASNISCRPTWTKNRPSFPSLEGDGWSWWWSLLGYFRVEFFFPTPSAFSVLSSCMLTWVSQSI